MAIFQPSNVIPDVRSGIGNGVIDATDDLTVSWRINGQSALTQFEISICENTAASTELLNTTTLNSGTPLSVGCPAYGTDSAGNPQFFSYTIAAADIASATITNGNEYKIIIKQRWGNSDAESITQSSASVFITRATPTVSIDAIGVGGVIGTRSYTFTGAYTQAQSDVLNWLRWEIAYDDDLDNPFFDSGKISGTMELSCAYDGFFASTDYAIRLSVQTENGVEATSGWVNFSCNYTVQDASGDLVAGCVGGTDAVLVEWSKIGYIPGEASGDYTLANGFVTLPSGSTVTWDEVSLAPMNFADPWSVVWRGQLLYADANIFTINGDLELVYNDSAGEISLMQNGSALATENVHRNAIVTVILTQDKLYIREDYFWGGLHPAATLYPGTSLYPQADDTAANNEVEASISYTQAAITSVQIGGTQICDFIEVINGDASAEIIAAAITNGVYTLGASADDYMLADFSDDLSAGSLSLNGATITKFAVYRRQGNEGRLVHIATVENTVTKVYDYSAASQQGIYTYYLFFIGEDANGEEIYIASPIESGAVMPCWWNWTLMECAETADENIFTVLAAYKFRLNISSGTVSNNNSPNVLLNFTRYPKVQIAPQNYKSGTLAGLIGAVDWSSGQPQYIETIAWRDALYALSVSTNPLFLKNRKGDLLRVQIVAPISMTTADETREQMQTISLSWAEVNDANDVSLYSTEYVGVQSAEGISKPQYYVDASDATADAKDILLDKKAVGQNGMMIGEGEFIVEDKLLIAPDALA